VALARDYGLPCIKVEDKEVKLGVIPQTMFFNKFTETYT
jgi:hypothetical protein